MERHWCAFPLLLARLSTVAGVAERLSFARVGLGLLRRLGETFSMLPIPVRTSTCKSTPLLLLAVVHCVWMRFPNRMAGTHCGEEELLSVCQCRSTSTIKMFDEHVWTLGRNRLLQLQEYIPAVRQYTRSTVDPRQFFQNLIRRTSPWNQVPSDGEIWQSLLFLSPFLRCAVFLIVCYPPSSRSFSPFHSHSSLLFSPEKSFLPRFGGFHLPNKLTISPLRWC